ncbi:WYL domain-containing protein [Limnohabitans sp.]
MTISVLDQFSVAQRERLAYIEFRLWFFGEVTRKSVLERFGVATAAGTRDLMLYRELAPQNAEYVSKVYRYLPTFRPMFQHQAYRVLSALTSGFGDGERDDAGAVLPHELPVRLNQPSLDVLATVTRAIHGVYPLKLIYHSLKTGPVSREMVPHALVDSGLRWHVRAFDRTKGEFRDLVLTRMEKVTPIKKTAANSLAQVHELPTSDTQWQHMVSLVLKPHPAHKQQASVARDFGMTNGVLRVAVRAAVLGHMLLQWQVDCSPQATLRGAEYRLRLANLEALEGVGSAELAPGYSGA